MPTWSCGHNVQRAVSRCFTALRQLRQIRRSVPPSMSQTLVVTGGIEARLWKRRAGKPSGLSSTSPIQSALNAAARLIYHMRSADHITDALVSLRWLRVSERIQYKIALLTYEVLHCKEKRFQKRVSKGFLGVKGLLPCRKP